MKKTAVTLFSTLVLCAAPAICKSSGKGHSHASSTKCTTCARNSHGRIKRDPAAKRAFQKANPCPSTGKTTGACHGYVIDHVVPLKRGGADKPENMQWQTVAAAKAKDKIE
jgi:hypothetical protein